MLEKFLTTPEVEFAALLRSSPSLDLEADGKREAYRYARVGLYWCLRRVIVLTQIYTFVSLETISCVLSSIAMIHGCQERECSISRPVRLSRFEWI